MLTISELTCYRRYGRALGRAQSETVCLPAGLKIMENSVPSDAITKATAGLVPKSKLRLPPVLQPDEVVAQNRYGELKYFPIDIALQRLVDLDLITHGKPTIYFAELNRLSSASARNLYHDSLTSCIADLVSSSRTQGLIKARTVVNFAADRQSLDGIESVFLSGMSILQFNGSDTLTRGFSLLSSLPNGIDHLGGGMPIALFSDSQSRSISGITLDEFNGLISSVGVNSIKQGSDIGSTVARVLDASPETVKKAKENVCIAEAAGIGTIVGTIVGTVATRNPAGGIVGGVLGGIVGVGFGTLLCSGGTSSGTSPSEPSTSPGDGQNTGTPSAPATPAAVQPSTPGPQEPEPATPDDDDGTPTEGGPDSGEENRGVFDFDGDDPSDTPRHGAQHLPIGWMPDRRAVRRLTNSGDPIRADFSQMAHFVDGDDGLVPVMGKLGRDSVINPTRGDGTPSEVGGAAPKGQTGPGTVINPVRDGGSILTPDPKPRGAPGGIGPVAASGPHAGFSLQLDGERPQAQDAWLLIGEGIARALLRQQ